MMQVKNKILFTLGMVIIIILATTTISKGATSKTTENSDYIYLSDISYIKDKSFASSGQSILLDKNKDNNLINLKMNNVSVPFVKGICAWATSEIVYDLREYDYDYFTSYIGVDISEQSNYFNSGAKFYIYTSDDGEDWKEQYKSDVLYGWSEAQFIKINIKDANYLKLVTDENKEHAGDWWSNWYDETVFANAKLIKDGYEENYSNYDFIKTVAEYDVIIKNHYGEEISGDYELTLLQRELVNNVGYDNLQALANYSKDCKETIYWLMNDKETLRLYLAGGKPEGTYYNSIKVLTDLYTTYKDDLENENKTEYGTTLSDLYRTMMLSLSLTESGNVYLWIDGVNHSDANTRYEIYKELHMHEGQAEELIENKIFESLTVEEMRWVMNTIIDDEEILWLNDYVRNEKNGATGPYDYIKYTFDYNYNLDKYYDPENYNKWDEKYNLSKFNITYEKGQPKLWIVFEEGAVCGGISKTGSCIWGAYKGLPNTCVSQPGHCAYLYYKQDENGNGVWNLGNDISGWGQSGRTEHLNVRTMNDWGNGSYTSGWNASYILLAQAAQNEYNKYEKAEEILMLAKVYSDDNEKLEEIYRKALEAEKLNFDAWLGLVNLYNSDSTKTEKDYYELAEEIAETYTYYPRPMYDLLNLIKTHMTSIEYQTILSLLETRTLTTATRATSADSIQANAVKQIANALLGNIDTSIANFSFDGDNGGSIVLSSRFDGVDVAWDYSLDGGQTWTISEEHILPLADEQINSITAELDIKVHIIGVDYSEDNIYTIDIKTSSGLPANLYANDLENKVIGAINAMEWKYNEDDEWISYSEEEPDLKGNKSVIVRMGATGVFLADTNTKTYNFTEDSQPDTQKYISIDRLSVYQVSSEEPGHNEQAQNAIDGNINTIWHSNWNGQDSDRYITLKLDEPVYLSALEFVPRQNGSNGRIKNGKILVSMDGNEWTQVATINNWANSADSKIAIFEDSVKAQYVKLVATENYGDGRNFISAAMINLYEDKTKNTKPTAEIVYDIKNLTNSNVTATLTNPSTDITITNNSGKDSYVFTQNGDFTFEFVDKNGNKGEATASVNWIDKIAPTATISYDIEKETNQSVTAKISGFSEKVTIINNSGSDTYTFETNGSFKFEFMDEAGNIGTVTASVNWIDKIAPTATISYDIEKETNQSVTAKISDFSEKITIINNSGSDTYTFETNGSFKFEFMDEAGNIGTVTASVNWIDKIAPTATISYDIEKETDQPVTAKISGFSEKVTIINNSGSDTYTFETNGSFKFEFMDEAGNIGTATATVNWIKEESQTPNPDPDEEQKPDETQDLNQIKTSNTNRSDTTVTNKILPNTGTNNIILIILLGVSIIAIIFYIRVRTLRKKTKHL